MTLVDSSVWIDFFRALHTPQTMALRERMRRESVIVGDLILTEVLQGCVTEKDFRLTLRSLTQLRVIRISDKPIAIKAARNYIHLRTIGVTVRKTIDTLIATRCIEDGITLLHNDRDFLPFQVHLGLKCVAC